ncbi:MAG: hypothetical protein WB760_13750 [Xanthobacteraceae bacterium]
MADRYNEGKAIDAVLRQIEARENSLRFDDGRSPDDLRDADPERRVDYVCSVGKQLYAFEHTGIEPFPNQIEVEVHNRNLFRPIMEQFDNRTSDAEYWELHHPVEASIGLSEAKIKQIQSALINWIDANITKLPLTRYGNKYPYPALREAIPGVPFNLSLYRWSLGDFENSPLGGRLQRCPCVTGDVEKARLVRLQKACEDKFFKLAKWKRDEGAQTVLILEENDLSLTNPERVYNALVLAEAGKLNAPDEIFLVGTSIPQTWWVSCLRRAGKTYYDDGERFHEVDPATLKQLTKR